MISAPHADGPPARLLIVPGLHDSGPEHWQTWLESRHRRAVRVVQGCWTEPDLARWSAQVGDTLEAAGPGPWVAVAHSFGVLALVAHLLQRPHSPVAEMLLVAPADPAKWGLQPHLGAAPPQRPGLLVASESDPWMRREAAEHWARAWGLPCFNLGDAGHINVESGFGAFPFAERWVRAALQRHGGPRSPRCCVRRFSPRPSPAAWPPG